MESAAVGKKLDIQAVEEVDIQVVVERGMRLDMVVDILVEVEEGQLDKKKAVVQFSRVKVKMKQQTQLKQNDKQILQIYNQQIVDRNLTTYGHGQANNCSR